MRRWIVVSGAVLSSFGLALFALKWWQSKSRDEIVRVEDEVPIAQVTKKVPTNQAALAIPTVAGLDLLQMSLSEGVVTAKAGDQRTARLTIDPELQRTAVTLMTAHHLPEASVVMIDVESAAVLVYASHVDKGPPRDLCSEATAPSASVFKVVTGSALVEDAHVSLDQKYCYSGGEQRIHPIDLVEDAARDKWCVTLAGAMGRSINTVFARLAKSNLKPAQLELMARRFGYGESVPFDVPVQPSALQIPTDTLEFARTAAGFWNTTLSPIEAAWMSATVARGGEALRPYVVREVVDGEGTVVFSAQPAPVVRRAIAKDTAAAVTQMMEHTVTDGTSYRAFHDAGSRSFLPSISVAGKTGTLTDATSNRFYTWFTGFAPSKPIAQGTRPVAIAVLVVNEPTWQVKANVIARELLRAYFAQQKVPGVTKPQMNPVARHAGKGKK